MPSYRSQREQRTAAVSAAMHVGAAVSVVGKRPAAPENLNWAAVGRLANAGVHLGNPVHETPVVAVASVVADAASTPTSSSDTPLAQNSTLSLTHTTWMQNQTKPLPNFSRLNAAQRKVAVFRCRCNFDCQHPKKQDKYILPNAQSNASQPRQLD